MVMFCTRENVKTFLGLDLAGTKYDSVIDDAIEASSEQLQGDTGRQFEPLTGATKRYTTLGRATLAIHDLRTPSSVKLSGASLTADSTYWLIPDWRTPGVYTAIQLRGYSTARGPAYLSNPEWFDRNLDSPYIGLGSGGGLPNDLEIIGDWGHGTVAVPVYPEQLVEATKILSAWKTKRRDAQLANTIQTPEGNTLDYSQVPPEVGMFVEAWRLGSGQVALV
jgi:hypothetical protein